MRGLYNKYDVWNNEKGNWMRDPALVVKLKDPHGRVAIKAYADPEIDENITLVEINARNASHIIRETYCVVTNVDLADNQYFAM